MPSFGDPMEELAVGPVRVIIRYSCVRRDQYDLLTSQPFPSALNDKLAALGVRRGNDVLYTVDVPGVHQLTVAPERGRLVIMPRLSTPRDSQRAAAIAVAELISEALSASGR